MNGNWCAFLLKPSLNAVITRDTSMMIVRVGRIVTSVVASSIVASGSVSQVTWNVIVNPNTARLHRHAVSVIVNMHVHTTPVFWSTVMSSTTSLLSLSLTLMLYNALTLLLTSSDGIRS